VQEGESASGQGRQRVMEGHAEYGHERGGDGALWQRIKSAKAHSPASLFCDGYNRSLEGYRRWAFTSWRARCKGAAGFSGKHFSSHNNPVAATLWGQLSDHWLRSSPLFAPSGIFRGAVLWNGGISFGGVIAFIYADLIIFSDHRHLPKVLRLESDYTRCCSFYCAMAVAALIIEFLSAFSD